MNRLIVLNRLLICNYNRKHLRITTAKDTITGLSQLISFSCFLSPRSLSLHAFFFIGYHVQEKERGDDLRRAGKYLFVVKYKAIE